MRRVPSVGARPADASSDTSRTRRLLSGVAASIVSRGLAAVSPLVVIPIALAYLGEEIYGLWMTVLGVTAMAAFADLGLGFGLMTKLAPCRAHGHFRCARQLISSAYAVLGVMAFVALVVLWTVGPHLPWARLLNAHTPAGISESSAVALVVITSFVMSVPLGIISRIQYAYQRVAQSNLWQAGGSLLSVVLVVLATSFNLPPVAVVAASVLALPTVYLLNAIWFFVVQEPALRPNPRSIDRDQAQGLVRLGGAFFILTAVISIAVNADNFIIARTQGLAAVAQFSTLARLFGALGVLVSLVNVPLWPTAGEALARGDFGWVRRITRLMTLVSFATVIIPGLLLIIAGRSVVDAWLPQVDYFTTGLAIGLTLWWVSQATISPRFMVQNGAAVLRPQFVGWSMFALISIPLKWFACARWGIVAVPLVGAGVYLTTVIPSALVGYRLAVARHERVAGSG